VASCYVASYDVARCYVVSCYVASCVVASCDVVSCYIANCRGTLGTIGINLNRYSRHMISMIPHFR
jgi:hypothetical protein